MNFCASSFASSPQLIVEVQIALICRNPWLFDPSLLHHDYPNLILVWVDSQDAKTLRVLATWTVGGPSTYRQLGAGVEERGPRETVKSVVDDWLLMASSTHGYDQQLSPNISNEYSHVEPFFLSPRDLFA